MVSYGSVQIGDSVVLTSSCRVRGVLCRGVGDDTCVLFDTSFLLGFSAILSVCSDTRSSFSSGTRFRVVNTIADSAEKVGARAGSVALICQEGLLGVDAVTPIGGGFFSSVWQICWGL